MFATQGQFLELLACIFGGIVIGIIYDVLHFSDVPKFNKWVVAAIDVVFVVLGTAVFVLVTYLASFGEVRFYSVLGFVIGFIAERFSIKILVAKAVRAVYNYIIKIKNKLFVPLAQKRTAKKLRKKAAQNEKALLKKKSAQEIKSRKIRKESGKKPRKKNDRIAV